jgi:hypothetical protein
VRSGYRFRIEVYYEATLTGGLDGLTLDPKEVLEARLFARTDLPAAMPAPHRELALALVADTASNRLHTLVQPPRWPGGI